MVGRVGAIVVCFVDEKLVAICELLLVVPGLVVSRGGLMIGWVVAVGLLIALFWPLGQGGWSPLGGPRRHFC